MAETKKSPSPSGEGMGVGNPLAQYARQMRREPTEPEMRLWRGLSNRQLGGFKFRQQAKLGDRIADFFCPAIGLIVEVDGHTHEVSSDVIKDRDAATMGLTTVRVTNNDVMQNVQGVLEHILATAQSLPPRSQWRLPRPNPSGEGEGLK